MKGQQKFILSVYLVILLIIGASGYAYPSKYYHTGKTALAAMAYQATGHIQIERSGLVLLAAYSVQNWAGSILDVLSGHGSEGGGCRAPFGSYGPQDGGGTPTISDEEQIRQTAEAIAVGQVFPAPRSSLYDRFMRCPVNPFSSSKRRHLRPTNACTGCGQCAQFCPTNNITIQNERPVWGGDCIHCMTCI